MDKATCLDKLLATLYAPPEYELPNLLEMTHAEKHALLRAWMNTWDLSPLPEEVLSLQDTYLALERENSITVPVLTLPTVAQQFPQTRFPEAEHLVLWKGDITTLACDAIVNAANSRMLGCFVPLHKCIDNAIHSAAGLRLRVRCQEIMQAQGHAEPTGRAKLTPGYALPATHVLHTVGPIIRPGAAVTQVDCDALASCYRSCLEVSKSHPEIRTVAFCCISTGEFHFPQALAARIATDTVVAWLKDNPGRMDRIVFNVFTDVDQAHYQALLQ